MNGTLRPALPPLLGRYPLRQEARSAWRFWCVGLSGVAVNSGVLWLLTEAAGLHYLASGALAAEVAIISNFLLNNGWTFNGYRSRGPLPLKLARYNLVALSGLAMTVGWLFFFTAVLRLHYMAANLLAIAFTGGWNYLLSRVWIWRQLRP